MLSALASDFAAIPDVEVTFFQDRRVRNKISIPGATRIVIESPIDLFRHFRDLADKVDHGVVIAPEFNDHLRDWSSRWTALGGNLLGPSETFVHIASSKQATAEHLAAAGVPVPRGMQLGWPDDLPDNLEYPAILKPDDGVGSQGILYLKQRADGRVERRMNTPVWRLERYCPGIPCSVALLAGPQGMVTLPACLQWLSRDGKFQYRGGMTPIAAPLNARAQRLALAAAQAMPPAHGYFGVDLVLGDAEDGSQDFVIEINPRLTTSYVGLRSLACTNLAQAMLDVAAGRSCDLSFETRRIQFTPDGQVVALS